MLKHKHKLPGAVFYGTAAYPFAAGMRSWARYSLGVMP